MTPDNYIIYIYGWKIVFWIFSKVSKALGASLQAENGSFWTKKENKFVYMKK